MNCRETAGRTCLVYICRIGRFTPSSWPHSSWRWVLIPGRTHISHREATELLDTVDPSDLALTSNPSDTCASELQNYPYPGGFVPRSAMRTNRPPLRVRTACGILILGRIGPETRMQLRYWVLLNTNRTPMGNFWSLCACWLRCRIGIHGLHRVREDHRRKPSAPKGGSHPIHHAERDQCGWIIQVVLALVCLVRMGWVK